MIKIKFYTEIYKIMVTESLKNIDTPVKAYVLGFIIADGVISSKYKVSISSKDFEILEKCKNILGCDNKISDINYCDSRTEKNYHTHILQIGSKKLVEELHNLGVHPRKSWTSTFPDMDDKYHSHFLRGLFDGDGSISFLKKNGMPRFSIIGSEFLIRDVQDIKKQTTIVRREERKKIMKMYFGGRFQILKVLDWLYDGSTESARLNRKYERYLQLRDTPIKRTSGEYKSSSKYVGVHFKTTNKKWIACYNGKHLGSFETEDDAARCYNDICFYAHGDKNRLNKIEIINI